MRKYDYSESVVLLDEEEGFGLEIPRRYEIFEDLTSLNNDYEWQVTYKFTSDFRPNMFLKKYGADNMTYRRLYEILCQKFNGGVYFLDSYFNEIFPSTLKPEFDDYLEGLKNVLMMSVQKKIQDLLISGALKLNKNGTLNKSYTRGLQQVALVALNNNCEVKAQGEYFASRIKEDVIQCLASGQLPLMTHHLSKVTQYQRESAGLPEYPRFFASGEFINNLLVFVRLEKKKWQTQYNMVV